MHMSHPVRAHADIPHRRFVLRIVALALSACLLGFAGVASAVAAPVSGAAHVSANTESGVTHVQQRHHRNDSFGKHNRYNKHNKFNRSGHKHRHGFRPGSRHSHAPNGWHRHSSRPSYWQTRGCVVVGPVWFCP
jgi:hypothetical protein